MTFNYEKPIICPVIFRVVEVFISSKFGPFCIESLRLARRRLFRYIFFVRRKNRFYFKKPINFHG